MRIMAIQQTYVFVGHRNIHNISFSGKKDILSHVKIMYEICARLVREYRSQVLQPLAILKRSDL